MHVELTTLIVPGFNDSDEQMREECRWIASLSEDSVASIALFSALSYDYGESYTSWRRCCG
ncbi:MAG: hypothetical protein R2912_11830 [Eubacteriales bacterium]